MRLKTLGNGMRVYLSPDDFQTMIDSAENRQAEMAMKVMGRCGLRVGELDFGPDDVRESSNEDVDILFLTVYGKDTKDRDTDGKRRDAWLPRDLYQELEQYREIEGLSEQIGYFPKTNRSMSRYIKESAKNAALRTGNDDFREVTAHDFRAYFATNMLLREKVDVEVVMELGGWVDRDTMDPYLNASFDDIIQDELANAGVLGDSVETEPDQLEQIRREITHLRESLSSLKPRGNIDPLDDDTQAGFDDF